ncbi:MAG TPA: RsmE family RNA methyltransferase [Eubacteriales bacterium]|jgi:16S rRNA (uracil1498-N3)-methyltransferase|nr:RsmE family RNA methyltransferase [Clostridia bacterium]HRV73633.1 RsmE family RNA methyltransferase [Eubacteriales bacterium]
MNRFFAVKAPNGAAYIEGEENVRHLSKSLRLCEGDRVQLFDGEGFECEAEIQSVERSRIALSCGEWTLSPAEPTHRVTLFQGLPKQGKMETIIQKCVELGVYEIVPLVTSRCVVQLSDKLDRKLERYGKVAFEAAQQSKRGCVPRIFEPVKLSELPVSSFDLVLIAYEDERESSLKSLISGFGGNTVAIVIGPEGGFDPDEVSLLVERGAKAVSLGRRILRTETAGMAMTAQILYELETEV